MAGTLWPFWSNKCSPKLTKSTLKGMSPLELLDEKEAMKLYSFEKKLNDIFRFFCSKSGHSIEVVISTSWTLQEVVFWHWGVCLAKGLAVYQCVCFLWFFFHNQFIFCCCAKNLFINMLRDFFCFCAPRLNDLRHIVWVCKSVFSELQLFSCDFNPAECFDTYVHYTGSSSHACIYSSVLDLAILHCLFVTVHLLALYKLASLFRVCRKLDMVAALIQPPTPHLRGRKCLWKSHSWAVCLDLPFMGFQLNFTELYRLMRKSVRHNSLRSCTWSLRSHFSCRVTPSGVICHQPWQVFCC